MNDRRLPAEPASQSHPRDNRLSDSCRTKSTRPLLEHVFCVRSRRVHRFRRRATTAAAFRRATLRASQVSSHGQIGASFRGSRTDTEFVGNFLKWTGHQGAVSLSFALFTLGGLMAGGPLTWIDPQRPIAIWISLGGLALAIPTFAGLCIFVRCPRCRTRLLWHAVSKDAHPRGLNAILLATKCPCCDFPESAPSHGHQTAGAPIGDGR